MYKVIYWSKKFEKIIVIYFQTDKGVAKYFALYSDDMDLENHFVKIVKENN